MQMNDLIHSLNGQPLPFIRRKLSSVAEVSATPSDLASTSSGASPDEFVGKTMSDYESPLVEVHFEQKPSASVGSLAS